MPLDESLRDLACAWAAQMGPPPPRYTPPALRPTKAVSLGQERHLIAKYKTGDRAAGEALLRLHDKALRLACWKRRGQGEEADLLQEARLELLEHARRFDPERDSSLMSYAHKGIHGRVLRRAVEATSRKQREVSIEEPIGEEDDRTFGDFLRYGSTPEEILLAVEEFQTSATRHARWRSDATEETPDGRAGQALDLLRRL